MSPEQEPARYWIDCLIWDEETGERTGCCCDHAGCCRWSDDESDWGDE